MRTASRVTMSPLCCDAVRSVALDWQQPTGSAPPARAVQTPSINYCIHDTMHDTREYSTRQLYLLHGGILFFYNFAPVSGLLSFGFVSRFK